MALAERLLAAEFGEDIVDHHTYVLCSDGDLMEGVSHEAIALAGHLKLNKLIFLFDDNGITIDGPITLTDNVDQVARFKAAGWNAEAHRRPGPEGDRRRDRRRAQTSDRPSLIACKTTIGFGAPTKAGTSKAHGEALGAENSPAPKGAGLELRRRSKFPTTSCRTGATSATAGRQRARPWASRFAGQGRPSAANSSGVSPQAPPASPTAIAS